MPDSAPPTVTRAAGAIPDTPDNRDRELNMNHMKMIESLPVDFNMNGTVLNPKIPVYDQGNVPSCTCNAIAMAYRLELDRLGKQKILPSRLFLYFLGRDPIPKSANDRYLYGKPQNDGTRTRDILWALQKFGVCREPPDVGMKFDMSAWQVSQALHNSQTADEWPYDAHGPGSDGKYSDGQISGRYPPEECYNAAKFHLSFAYMRPPDDIECWRRCIGTGFPLIVGFKLFKSFDDPTFQNWETSDFGGPQSIAPVPKQQEVNAEIEKIKAAAKAGNLDARMGGHTVLLVGFHNEMPYHNKDGKVAKGCFIAQNSWGPNWGKLTGFFYMPYAWLTDRYDLPSDGLQYPGIMACSRVIDEPGAWVLIQTVNDPKLKDSVLSAS
ncbi:hypothetical protein ABW21_db0203395 [Orbilia brochopaga]|nr:hypothetical protein ABW21_db0203395 [Drechslerella brochopaga]